ncbi:MAG TPA: class I SAM-dependent methyltransferase [Mycobacteriales bacterium]|nr:class I SAM-dependent methyltransferase [Mycobacteriales bacterium]
MAAVERPGSGTAFEELVDDYDAARPHYPSALYDELPLAGSAVLELGAGTGIASTQLAARAGSLVVTDLGPRMLARGLTKHDWPGAVCRAEALPFAEAVFDLVCGAQMWHWTEEPAAAEVARVLRPGGRVALWWNEVEADGSWWFDAQQDRLEAGNARYHRGYRDADYRAALRPSFHGPPPREIRWERVLPVDLYERWLRSKSYVQALPDVEDFVAACRADLFAAFPDGQVVEPFVTRLFLLEKR